MLIYEGKGCKGHCDKCGFETPVLPNGIEAFRYMREDDWLIQAKTDLCPDCYMGERVLAFLKRKYTSAKSNLKEMYYGKPLSRVSQQDEKIVVISPCERCEYYREQTETQGRCHKLALPVAKDFYCGGYREKTR